MQMEVKEILSATSKWPYIIKPQGTWSLMILLLL